uniref:Uncharacterized protein LOC114344494 n=1 Tax=Diabrotica virgifera virgifera TaxID=50390 RepID=A0A6P7H074_DIAVI
MNSFDTQNAYLQGCMRYKNVIRKKTKALVSKRSQTIEYKLKSQGKDVKVCKIAFLSIHGLQKNRGRVENLVKQLKTGSNTPKSDLRGRHSNHPKNIPILI